MVWKFQGQK